MAGSALLAPMLQTLMGYSATDAGVVSMPRGLGTLASMMLAGRLIKHMDGRILVAVGLACSAISLWMMSGFSLEMDRTPIIVSGVIQGLGFGLTFMPLNLYAFSTLSDKLRTDGTAMYSLVRTLGGSVAISIGSALLVRNAQVSHSDLAQHFTKLSMPWFDSMIVQRIGNAALQMLDVEINRQALMIAYIDDFYLMFWATVITIPLILLVRKPTTLGDTTEAMAMAD